MTLIQIDPIGWLPDSFKQQIIDSVVTFVADQAESGIPPRARRTRKDLKSSSGARHLPGLS